MWSAAISPATIAAALEPSPPLSGIFDEIRNSKPSAGCSRSNARTTRLRAVARDVELGVHGERRRSPTPRARDGAPAPRRARQTPGRGWPRTRAREPAAAGSASSEHRRLDRRQLGLARDARRPACASAVCGSLSPWPVSTHTIRRASPGAVGEQPGDAGRRGRLAEDALVGGEEAVGVEDLLVGDGATAPPRRSSRPSPPPSARGCRSGSRWRPSPGCSTGCAEDERRGPRGLEAEHPGRMPTSWNPRQ